MDGKLLELNDAITAMNRRDKRGYVGPEYQHLHGLVHEVSAEVERLTVDCECHRIQAVDRGNSYQKAIAERNRYKAALDRIASGETGIEPFPHRNLERACMISIAAEAVRG